MTSTPVQGSINLIEKYQENGNYKGILHSFKSFMPKITGFTLENEAYGLKKGDVINFRNGYGIPMVSEILGFDKDGEAYIMWDCYWSPIKLEQRLISKL